MTIRPGGNIGPPPQTGKTKKKKRKKKSDEKPGGGHQNGLEECKTGKEGS